MDDLAKRIEKIEERNGRVEADKKWETSLVRRISIAVLTYGVICLFLMVIHEKQVLLKALVPVLGFALSTISMRVIKKGAGY